jgi:putative polyketide hydroxylase
MNSDSAVAIVGAGPCGLMTALLLARAGVRCTVFEKKPGISTHPKAMGVSRRTAELYRQLGLIDAIAEGLLGRDDRLLAIWSKSLVGEELGRVPLTHLHSEFTPCTALHCPQTRTEKVLLDAVTAEPLATVRFGTEIQDVEVRDDYVRLSLSENEWFGVPWVVAADGAGSGVRRKLNIETDGPGDMGHFLNTMFRARYGAHLEERPAILYNTISNEFFEFFVAIDGEELWLMHHFLQPGETIDDFPVERLESMIRKASGLPDEPVDVLSVMPWVMSPKVARQLRIGRLFLVGDAAARLSPSGGLGLNTGLQGVHNLAWKLAFVINGGAGQALLDTYHEERHGVAHWTMQNTNRSADEIFGIVSIAMEDDWDKVCELIGKSRRRGSGLGQDLGLSYEFGAFIDDGTEKPAVPDPINDYHPTARPGARAPHLWIDGHGDKKSTLDLFGETFVLVTGRACQLTGMKGDLLRVLRNQRDFVGDVFEELYGISDKGGVLVRPDGYVGARWRELRGGEEVMAGINMLLRR